MTRSTKIKFIMIIAACVFSLSCKRQTWYRAKDGLEYTIISNGSGPVITPGSTVKLRFEEKINDSVLWTTKNNMPDYQQLIPGLMPPGSFMETFAYGLKEGDSVLVIQSVDSLQKKGLLPPKAPWLHPGEQLKTTFKIIRVFPQDILRPLRNDSLLKADQLAERARLDQLQFRLGVQRTISYLQGRQVPAIKTAAGTWLWVLTQGSGPLAGPGDTLYLKYRLKNLAGKLLGSNMDTAFHQPGILKQVAGDKHLPNAIDQTLRGIGKGTHAVIYVPAMLGFGGRPSGQHSLAYDDLAMEVYITDIKPMKKKYGNTNP